MRSCSWAVRLGREVWQSRKRRLVNSRRKIVLPRQHKSNSKTSPTYLKINHTRSLAEAKVFHELGPPDPAHVFWPKAESDSHALDDASIFVFWLRRVHGARGAERRRHGRRRDRKRLVPVVLHPCQHAATVSLHFEELTSSQVPSSPLRLPRRPTNVFRSNGTSG